MLYDKLKDNRRIPFHMPGHKRNTTLLGSNFPYNIDITEIEGFDNLHSPEGLIKNIENKAKKIYNSDNSFLLVNGSTVGVLAGIATVLKRGDTALIARNCHKSVYNAIELIGGEVEYILPDTDEYGIFKCIDNSKLELKISRINPKLMVVTSPTYEGVNSDIKGICDIAHKYNIPVLVDAAHGAHITDYVKYADITIMSLHKTLPALTQCALAHVNGNLVSAEDFRIKLSVFETSSPSYVLMTSIENCLDFMVKNVKLFGKFAEEKSKLKNNLSDLKYLKAVEYDDITKLVVFTGYSNISGIELADILRNEYNIEVEMACKDYVVLIFSVCDSFVNYKTLENALIDIDSSLYFSEFDNCLSYELPKKTCNFNIANKELIDFKNSKDRVCAEFIWAYPPGIPLLTPGEVITQSEIDYILNQIKSNVNIQSTRNKLPENIYVKCL